MDAVIPQETFFQGIQIMIDPIKELIGTDNRNAILSSCLIDGVIKILPALGAFRFDIKLAVSRYQRVIKIAGSDDGRFAFPERENLLENGALTFLVWLINLG
jgi:hypothetical protein